MNAQQEPQCKQRRVEAGQVGPKPNRPQVKISEELKLSSKYSYVLYQ